MTFGIVLFIVALLVVIMIHETGHFLVAKALGFKATKFFVGFGPTVWSFQRGETEYGIKAIPAGGFVKIVGMNPYEEVAPEDESRSYPNKPRWQRALMIAAGPATHWPLAFVILLVTALTLGFPTGQATNVVSQIETQINGTQTPAMAAGLQPGDHIIAVNGEEVTSWSQTRAAIRSNAGRATTFTYERDGETRETTTTLGTAIFNKQGEVVDYAPPGEDVRPLKPGEQTAGFLGVQPEERFDKPGLVGGITASAKRTVSLTGFLVTTIGQPFTSVFNGDLFDALRGHGPRTPEEGPVGIVGAGRIAGASVQNHRYADFVGLMVGLTIFVGLINLLPLPPLDGGHLAVILYEVITRRRVDIRKLIPIAAAVISFFVLLFFAVLYLDLARPLQVPL
ncbi:MAG TPA: site-2 protease family protein [Actinomycetota bacterium]|nr:site-2 protease family protein [Actinomycetota bacterium]